MLLLDVTIVNVALPDIQTALHSSFSDLQWVVDAYALTLAALLLTAGSLADMFGRRRLYVIGLVIFTVASLLCGLAQDTLMLQLSACAAGRRRRRSCSRSRSPCWPTPSAARTAGWPSASGARSPGSPSPIGPLLGGALTSGPVVAVDLLRQPADRRPRRRAVA